MAKFGQNDPIESCLELGDDNCLQYTTNFGNPKIVKLPVDKVASALSGDCELVIMVNGVECDRTELVQILDKYNFNYDPATHTITAGPDGNTSDFQLNCSTIELVVAEGECKIVHTNAKGAEEVVTLPGIKVAKDDEACTITIGDGKGTETTFYQGINPETDIKLGLNDNKDLSLCYKNQEHTVVLPNFVTDVVLDPTNCILKVFKWCDPEPMDIDLFAALGLTKTEAGGFELQIKDQICTYTPPTLTQDPNDPTKYNFNNGAGQTTVVDVNEVDMDINDITIENSVITFTAEDGTTIPVDICAIVAANCNATLTVNEDGSLTHVDNAGVSTPVNLCELIIDNCGSTVSANEEGVGGGLGTATIVQIDGTSKDNVVCGAQSSVAPNDAETGGGVGTATMTQNDGSIKDDVVCGVQSSITPNAEGEGGGPGTATIVQNDGSTKDDVMCGPILDKDGNAIDVTSAAFITTQFLQSFDFGLNVPFPGYANPAAVAGDADFCMPATPACPEIRQRTCDIARGIDWYWDGIGWTICSFCPAGDSNLEYPAEGQTVTLTDADLTAAEGAGFQVIQDLIHTTTNDDCVPRMLCVHNRTIYTGDVLTRAYFQFVFNVGPTQSPINTGFTPQWNYNTIAQLEGRVISFGSGNQDNRYCVKLQPGESHTTHMQVTMNVPVYEPSDIASIKVVLGGTYSDHTWQRCK